jgi:hypothetical protein
VDIPSPKVVHFGAFSWWHLSCDILRIEKTVMIIKKLIFTSTVGAGLGDKEGLAIDDLDLSLVAAVRGKLPLLKNRRADICADNGVAANLR